MKFNVGDRVVVGGAFDSLEFSGVIESVVADGRYAVRDDDFANKLVEWPERDLMLESEYFSE